MAEYGIQAVPDGTPQGPESGDRMAPTVPMSIAEAMAKMNAMQADAMSVGSTLGQIMSVPGPISQEGNSPLLDSDGDYDYDKSPDVAADESTQMDDNASVALQNPLG